MISYSMITIFLVFHTLMYLTRLKDCEISRQYMRYLENNDHTILGTVQLGLQSFTTITLRLLIEIMLLLAITLESN